MCLCGLGIISYLSGVSVDRRVCVRCARARVCVCSCMCAFGRSRVGRPSSVGRNLGILSVGAFS